MAEFPALPLFTDAYLRDCWHLTDAEHGRYLLLLMLIWQSPECRVPNDTEWLARKMRRTVEQFKCDVLPLVAEFCQTDGNWITQSRLTRERDYLRKRSKSQSVRAKSRWNKGKDVCPNDAYTHASGNAPTPTPTPTPIIEERTPLAPLEGGQEVEVILKQEKANGRRSRRERHTIRGSFEQATSYLRTAAPEAIDVRPSGNGGARNLPVLPGLRDGGS